MSSLTLLAPEQNIPSIALSTSDPVGEGLDLLVSLLVGDIHKNSFRGAACFWDLRPACEEDWCELVGFHLLSGLPCVPTASAHKPGETGSNILGGGGGGGKDTYSDAYPRYVLSQMGHVNTCYNWGTGP